MLEYVPGSRLICLCLLAGAAGSVRAAEWQWSVPVPGAWSAETGASPRAFLWIPPACAATRGVVASQHNMQERPILEHPSFRAALARLCFAEVWITPPLDLFFRVQLGAGRQFDGMLQALARESGYAELPTVPVVPLGHSAASSYPWLFAAWSPRRTLAAISISGRWPTAAEAATGVPGLVTFGESEPGARGIRARAASAAVSALVESGAGHFDISDEKVAFLAAYITSAARPRPGARAGGFLDPALAREAWRLRQRFQALPGVRLGLLHNGSLVAGPPDQREPLTLDFAPLDDSLTFALQGVLLDGPRPGAPPAGLQLISGPVALVGEGLFAVRFDRVGFDNLRRSSEIWLAAVYPGDAHVKRSVQPARMRIPLRLTEGAPQHITFPPLAGQRAGAGPIPLRATSSSGAKVRYYVREGPAEVCGEDLCLTTIPVRARLPITVTVVAWQWGRTAAPKRQSAEPVTRSFPVTAR
jgi:hypothetical protein